MPFQVSPGVNVSEIDLTTVIPAVSTSVGAFAGRFNWGPADVATLVSSEENLVDLFGKPNANTYEDFYTAANFLAYTNALRLVRVKQSAQLNAADFAGGGGGLAINNDAEFDAMTYDSTSNTFYARYPGQMGNDIQVQLCDHVGDPATMTGFQNFTSNTYFSDAPGTSTWVSDRGGSGDELHIAVIDSPTGTFSGVANSVLEIWPFLSKASDAKNSSGDSIYFKDVLNNQSAYLRVHSPTAATQGSYGSPADSQTFGNTAQGGLDFRLSGGADGPTAYAAGDFQTGYDHFNESDQEDVSLILAGSGGAGLNSADVINYAIDLSTTRKDSVTFFSPHKSDAVTPSTTALKSTAVLGFRNSDTNKNTSYAFMDSGWKYQYDKYNDVYRWVPLNADVAGLAARTDNQRDAWFSPAGYNRGQIKNIVKLAFNPTKAQRDSLYQKQINPVVSFPGQGTLLFGDKTQLTRPSAFDRLNVRRLFIVLEKAISTAAKFQLFEFNDTFTRSQFRNMVEPFLRDVRGRRGITDFKVVCDETNNPGSVVDRNEFVGDIYIKPVRSINFIQLNFVAVQTGVDFSEIVGKF